MKIYNKGSVGISGQDREYFQNFICGLEFKSTQLCHAPIKIKGDEQSDRKCICLLVWNRWMTFYK